jgi:hypothetical protein
MSDASQPQGATPSLGQRSRRATLGYTPGKRMGPVTLRRLEIASFSHSCVYMGLLLCAFVLGGPQPETFWLGLAHGVLWIVMSLVCIAAAKARVIPFWLAVTVAVLGGLGPFAGTIGFGYLERKTMKTVVE